MTRVFLLLAGLLGFTGVALGAFGAHALRSRLTPELLAVYQTGVQYHLVHAVALLGVAVWIGRGGGLAALWAGWLFVAGIALFSGSLYALALSGVRVLGAVTPLGGVAFLAGWVALVLEAWWTRS
jgi:uncharacterized membrane protein YgdD (TMEM256/DUF423 family)